MTSPHYPSGVKKKEASSYLQFSPLPARKAISAHAQKFTLSDESRSLQWNDFREPLYQARYELTETLVQPQVRIGCMVTSIAVGKSVPGDMK